MNGSEATVMKLTIDRAALLRALGHVQSVVERRNTIPILSNVLIAAEGDAARFSATDLDIEIVESAEARVSRAGSTTAPAHTLYEIARKLPEGSEVSLEASTDDAKLTLMAGRAKFDLPCLPASDFPQLSAEGLAHRFELGPSELARLIDKTRFAISTEETRYYLNGVHLHAKNTGSKGVLRAVATDGHRLALVENELPDGAAGMPPVIVPRKTVAELRKLLDDVDGAVGVAVSEAKVRFDLGRAVLTSKLIDGAFPDYERVIPKGNDKVLAVDNRAFAEAVDRVQTISAEKSRSVKLSVESDRLTLAVNNPEAGQAVEELSVDYQAEPINIGFNAKYLLDVAGQIEGTEAEFRFSDSASPTLILDRGDENAQYVLMPLRV
jgi:DNA polymerase-3 subunit beta